MSSNYTIETFKRDLRNGPYVGGGYPVIFTVSDRYSSRLCWSCCLENARDIIRAIRDSDASGWRIVDASPYREGPPLPCEHCGRLIPSAYGDPDLA